MHDIKKLIRPLITIEIGRISRGKYTFLIIPAFTFTLAIHATTVDWKNVHGIIPVAR